jgi:hypothetical protein
MEDESFDWNHMELNCSKIVLNYGEIWTGWMLYILFQIPWTPWRNFEDIFPEYWWFSNSLILVALLYPCWLIVFTLRKVPRLQGNMLKNRRLYILLLNVVHLCVSCHKICISESIWYNIYSPYLMLSVIHLELF